MKTLTQKELLPFIHGTLNTEVNDAGDVCFHRFTDAQAAVYKKVGIEQNLNYDERAAASSGVTLEMITDSEVIGLEFALKAACRPFAAFDCFVDGVLYDHWYTEELFWNVACFDLPEGTHKVQIFFPWSSITVLKRVVLSNGATAEPVSKDLRILAYGDSITQGYIGKHPSMNYVNHFARVLNAETVNQAIGGYYFDKETMDPALKSFRPDLITIAYGTNDYTVFGTKEAIDRNCREFLDKLRGIFPDTKILGILPIHRNDCRNDARNKMNDFKLDDTRKLLAEIYADYADVTVLPDNFFPKHNDFFAPDCLHPNDLGFAFYGQAVTAAILKML